LLCFVLAALASPFKSKLRLEAENAVLRHQLIVLRRSHPFEGRLLMRFLYHWLRGRLENLCVEWHQKRLGECGWRWWSLCRLFT